LYESNGIFNKDGVLLLPEEVDELSAWEIEKKGIRIAIMNI